MPEVIAKVPLSPQGRAILEFEDDDFAKQLVGQGLSVLRAYDHLHEMKLFILLCASRPREPIPVPPEIDSKVLHPFLEWPAFEEFCSQRLKGTLEHIPHDTPMTGRERLHMLEQARAQYGKHFDEALWERGLPVCTLTFVAH